MAADRNNLSDIESEEGNALLQNAKKAAQDETASKRQDDAVAAETEAKKRIAEHEEFEKARAARRDLREGHGRGQFEQVLNYVWKREWLKRQREFHEEQAAAIRELEAECSRNMEGISSAMRQSVQQEIMRRCLAAPPGGSVEPLDRLAPLLNSVSVFAHLLLYLESRTSLRFRHQAYNPRHFHSILRRGPRVAAAH